MCYNLGMTRVTVPSDNEERRAAGVTYEVVYGNPTERDSCTCASWHKARAKSGAWEQVLCRHLRAVLRSTSALPR